MQLLFGVTTLRVMWMRTRRRKALKFAPARKFEHISYQNGPPTSIFSKNSSFRNFGVMETDAWSRITFSFRNVGSSYFGKTKFKHIDAKWLEWFPEIHLFQHRKTNLNITIAQKKWQGFVDKSPLLMQLLFGVTTLRVMWMRTRRRKALKFAPARKFEHISCRNGPPASIVSKISSFQNFGIMKKLACVCITLLIRNVESSYSQRTKPWPIWIDQSWRIFI